jgi:DNA polymerase III epsilon subunit-like protein
MQVMLDLETLGTRPGCAILSIGACVFTPSGIGEKFYAVISRASCRLAGLVEDPDTLAWWSGQPAEAAKVLGEASDKAAPHPLGPVLFVFRSWLYDKGNVLGSKSSGVWGNGAAFDLSILGAAYDRCGFGGPPWSPWQERCYRTLKNLRPDVPMKRAGTHHDALADAISQAEHAVALMRALGLSWEAW